MQELDRENSCLEVVLDQGRRVRRDEAVPLALGRTVEDWAVQHAGVQGSKRWLQRVAAGREREDADLSTFEGYNAVVAGSEARGLLCCFTPAAPQLHWKGKRGASCVSLHADSGRDRGAAGRRDVARVPAGADRPPPRRDAVAQPQLPRAAVPPRCAGVCGSGFGCSADCVYIASCDLALLINTAVVWRGQPVLCFLPSGG